MKRFARMLIMLFQAGHAHHFAAPRRYSAVGFLLLVVLLTVMAGVARAAGDTGNRVGITGADIKPYLVAAYDELDISVAGHDELKTSVTVLPDGTISVPQAGTIHAAGMTIADLEKALVAAWSGVINQPEVTVSVRVATPQSVSVVGAVKLPGRYDYKQDMRVLDLLAVAGGLVDDVESTQATLITDHGAGSTELNVQRLIDNGDASQNIPLSPGDMLLVQYHEALQVQVAGDVLKPGSYASTSTGVSVVSMLAVAGGAAPDADLTRAQILHDGNATTVNLLPLSQNVGDPAGGMMLMPGDVLQIPQSVSKIAVLGQVTRPGPYDIPGGKTILLTGALVLCGGPTNDADLQHASLLHMGSDGKAQLIRVDITHVMSGKSPNLTLVPGDIVYLPLKHTKAPFDPFELLSIAPAIALLR